MIKELAAKLFGKKKRIAQKMAKTKGMEDYHDRQKYNRQVHHDMSKLAPAEFQKKYWGGKKYGEK